MFRVIAYLILTVFLITVVKGIIGIVAKGFSEAIRGSSAANARPAPESKVPLTGELKKDPVCGTYTSAASSLQQTVGGQTYYFCSPKCQETFLARS